MGKLTQLVDGCTEGSKGVTSELEALLSKGNTDDGNAPDNAEDPLEYCEEETAEYKPERVSNGMLLEVGLNSLAEGPDCEHSELEALKTYRNTYKCYAPNYTDKEPNECGDKSAGEQPEYVA